VLSVCTVVQKGGLTSPSAPTTRAVATVVARTRAAVTTSPSKTSTSSSTTFSVDRPIDRPPPVRPAVIQPRVGDVAVGSPRKPTPRVPGLRRGDQTPVTSDSVTAKTMSASPAMNVNKSSSSSSSSSSLSSLLRGRLAPASSTTHSKQCLSLCILISFCLFIAFLLQIFSAKRLHSYCGCPSVRPSVCLGVCHVSGTESSPGEIETSVFTVSYIACSL